MDPKLAKELIKGHETLRELYLRAAYEACSTGQPLEVWQLVQQSHTQDAKVRSLKSRYTMN